MENTELLNKNFTSNQIKAIKSLIAFIDENQPGTMLSDNNALYFIYNIKEFISRQITFECPKSFFDKIDPINLFSNFVTNDNIKILKYSHFKDEDQIVCYIDYSFKHENKELISKLVIVFNANYRQYEPQYNFVRVCPLDQIFYNKFHLLTTRLNIQDLIEIKILLELKKDYLINKDSIDLFKCLFDDENYPNLISKYEIYFDQIRDSNIHTNKYYYFVDFINEINALFKENINNYKLA